MKVWRKPSIASLIPDLVLFSGDNNQWDIIRGLLCPKSSGRFGDRKKIDGCTKHDIFLIVFFSVAHDDGMPRSLKHPLWTS